MRQKCIKWKLFCNGIKTIGNDNYMERLFQKHELQKLTQERPDNYERNQT